MKLKRLKEETPSYEGRYWSYHKRKFVPYDEWKEERWCDQKVQTVSEQMQDELEPIIHPTQHHESDDLELVK